ncbi:hypothetical protein [Bifidobacterium thermophilum]|uniref:Uncharacterized protein n=1 Tax=Bifidobacterium thermophilum TaxID=33905 RepID=A0A7X9RN30_9BIFI|nr:hypothetical protein [Bifidobacterium thermophilum]NME61519.1 hypothetical protein [Bifidobacterium thermophilum]
MTRLPRKHEMDWGYIRWTGYQAPATSGGTAWGRYRPRIVRVSPGCLSGIGAAANGFDSGPGNTVGNGSDNPRWQDDGYE